MDINKFRGSFSGEEMSRTNLFRVDVIPPIAMADADPEWRANSEFLSFRCKGSTTPGRSIQTLDFVDYGPLRKIPNGAIYEPVTMEFIVGSKHREKKFFEDWHFLIASVSSSHDVEYYNNIITDIRINQYNTRNNKVVTYILKEAYPIQIQQTSLDWEEMNTYEKMTIQMQFREYETEYSYVNNEERRRQLQALLFLPNDPRIIQPEISNIA